MTYENLAYTAIGFLVGVVTIIVLAIWENYRDD